MCEVPKKSQFCARQLVQRGTPGQGRIQGWRLWLPWTMPLGTMVVMISGDFYPDPPPFLEKIGMPPVKNPVYAPAAG